MNFRNVTKIICINHGRSQSSLKIILLQILGLIAAAVFLLVARGFFAEPAAAASQSAIFHSPQISQTSQSSRHLLAQAEGTGVLPGETQSTNPKSRSSQVTAVVPIWDPPPVPLLISPKNHAYLDHDTPTFEWELPDHLVPYDHVELIIDGETLFIDLPLVSTTNDDYVLTVEDGVFKLKLKSDHALDDDLHTWKVRAVDFHDHKTDSTTWSFTVDTKSPVILIIEVDDNEVAISSDDWETWPTEEFPLETKHDQPTVKGKTEPDTEVQLIITWPDGTQTNLKTISDDSGWFTFDLPTLLPDELIYISFVGIDKAGNVTLLDSLPLVYQPVKIIIEVPIGIFPDPFVIELPEFPPRLEWPKIELPPPIDKIVEPIEQEVWQPAVGFVNWAASLMVNFAGWFIGLIFILLSFYLAILYYLTGGAWRYFGRFGLLWMRAWLIGWSAGKHEWREDREDRRLPLFGFTLERYDKQSETIHKQVKFTNLQGRWDYEPQSEQLYGLQINNRRYAYPSWEMKVSEEREGTQRRLLVAGESWFTATKESGLATSIEAFVIKPALECILAGCARRTSLPWGAAWVYAPRAVLLSAWLLAFALLILATAWWSVLLFVLLSVVVWRDAAWRVPQAWKAYLV